MNKKLATIITINFMMFCWTSGTFAQSPYEFSWGKDGAIFGTAAISGIAAGIIISQVDALTEAQINALDRNDVNAFDRSATFNFSETADAISDVTAIACLGISAALLTSKNVRNDFHTFAIMYSQMLIFASALPSISKGLTKRARPFVYNEDAPFAKKLNKSSRLAFFSGHTTNAFAGAIFFATTFSDYFPKSKFKPYIWGGSIVLASVVAVTRVEAGRHYRTDVIAGAIVGSAIGYFVPRLHRRSKFNGLSVSPLYKDRQMQIGVNYSF